jgi:hypothetical protein|nr:MAG TPA: chromosome partition protein [Caudoviricetes sp.]
MRIGLKKLILENFMCYAHKEIIFGDNTKIAASNGKGKSSITNAYMWLLFNCDYQLSDNPPIRRMIGGKTVDDTDVSVTAVFDVDGKEIIMCKSQKRKYSKDGSSYKDDNSYSINDVPKTLRDFNAYLDADMSILKMCSNINAFLAKKPAEMREFLFGLVDGVSDVDVAKSKVELAELVPLLEKYTADELSAMNKATKSKVTKELPVLDGQIAEKERDIQIKQSVDISALELQKNVIKEKLSKVVEDQLDMDKVTAEHDEIADKILKLKFKISAMQNKANEALGCKRAALRSAIDDCKTTQMSVIQGISDNDWDIDQSTRTLSIWKSKKEKLVAEWKSVNVEKFNELTTICPTCHREFPAEDIERLKSDFAQNQAERLAAVEADGKAVAQKIKEIEEHIEKLKKCNELNRKTVADTGTKLTKLEEEYNALPLCVDISGDDEYIGVMAQIETFEINMAGMETTATRTRLKSEETVLRQELAECETQIAKSDTEADETRLEELMTGKRNLGQAQTDAQKILDLLDDLDKAKNEVLTNEINKHFGLVKWQLFEFAKNGGYKSTCIPTIDGKSILTTMSNKGNRILGRIDICNSIQQISNVACPIWLDDAESLDSANQQKAVDMVDGQIVMLAVNDNKELEVM